MTGNPLTHADAKKKNRDGDESLNRVRAQKSAAARRDPTRDVFTENLARSKRTSDWSGRADDTRRDT